MTYWMLWMGFSNYQVQCFLWHQSGLNPEKFYLDNNMRHGPIYPVKLEVNPFKKWQIYVFLFTQCKLVGFLEYFAVFGIHTNILFTAEIWLLPWTKQHLWENCHVNPSSSFSHKAANKQTNRKTNQLQKIASLAEVKR